MKQRTMSQAQKEVMSPVKTTACTEKARLRVRQPINEPESRQTFFGIGEYLKRENEFNANKYW